MKSGSSPREDARAGGSRRRWRRLPPALLTVLLAFPVGGFAPMGVASVTLYDRGRQVDLSPALPAVQELVAHCEKQLETADDILRLAVTPSLIQEVRAKELAVEIRYAEPKAFVIAFNKQTLRPLRLMVPLTGEYAGEVTTIFHGTTQYGAGPYRNSSGTAAIRAIAETLRGRQGG